MPLFSVYQVYFHGYNKEWKDVAPVSTHIFQILQTLQLLHHTKLQIILMKLMMVVTKFLDECIAPSSVLK